jgi:hypothetical protein
VRLRLIASKPADSVVPPTDRDYPGVVCAIGTDATAVEDARAQQSWPVTGPRS